MSTVVYLDWILIVSYISRIACAIVVPVFTPEEVSIITREGLVCLRVSDNNLIDCRAHDVERVIISNATGNRYLATSNKRVPRHRDTNEPATLQVSTCVVNRISRCVVVCRLYVRSARRSAANGVDRFAPRDHPSR